MQHFLTHHFADAPSGVLKPREGVSLFSRARFSWEHVTRNLAPRSALICGANALASEFACPAPVEEQGVDARVERARHIRFGQVDTDAVGGRAPNVA